MVSSSQPAGETVPRLGRRLVNHVKRSVAPSRLGRFYRLRRRSHVPSQRLDRVADDRVKEVHRARPDAAGEADQAAGRPSQAPGRERVLRCWLDHEAVARRRAAHRRSHRQPDSRRHSSGAHCPVGLTEPAVRGKRCREVFQWDLVVVRICHVVELVEAGLNSLFKADWMTALLTTGRGYRSPYRRIVVA